MCNQLKTFFVKVVNFLDLNECADIWPEKQCRKKKKKCKKDDKVKENCKNTCGECEIGELILEFVWREVILF